MALKVKEMQSNFFIRLFYKIIQSNLCYIRTIFYGRTGMQNQRRKGLRKVQSFNSSNHLSRHFYKREPYLDMKNHSYTIELSSRAFSFLHCHNLSSPKLSSSHRTKTINYGSFSHTRSTLTCSHLIYLLCYWLFLE